MKTLRHLLLALPLSLALHLPAQAQQGVDLAFLYTDFTTWTLAGNAVAQNQAPGEGFIYSAIRLTEGGRNDQVGTGFAPDAIYLDFNQAFRFNFNFYIPPSTGLRGDGLTFTLASNTGLGVGGSGLGYASLSSHSVALAFDTFNFDGEPVSPSLQILAGGSVTPLAATETGIGDAIRGAQYQSYAELTYTPSGNGDNAGTLAGLFSNLDLGSFAVRAEVSFADLGLVGVPVFYGFTGANGLATDEHFITSALAVPEPGSWAMILAGLGFIGLVAQRRSRR